MTIDEVIRHCEEVAKEQEGLYIICPASESEMSHFLVAIQTNCIFAFGVAQRWMKMNTR